MNFAEFYSKEYATVFYFVLGVVRNQETAKDVTADAMLKIYKGWQSFTGKSERRSWALAIAKYTAWKFLHSQPHHVSIDDDATLAETLTDPRDFAAELEKWQAYQLVNLKIQRLNRLKRQSIEGYIEGTSTKRLAREWRVPTGTVLSRIANAKKELRRLVAPKGN